MAHLQCQGRDLGRLKRGEKHGHKQLKRDKSQQHLTAANWPNPNSNPGQNLPDKSPTLAGWLTPQLLMAFLLT